MGKKGKESMNREEYCKCDNRNKYYYRVQKLLKDWKIKNNITERCVVHHIDNEPEAIKYNEAHYELFGFELDENGNLIFELGKYAQFMTAAEHIRHHHKGAKRSQETCEKMRQNHADFKGENHPRFGKKCSDETKQKISLANKGKLSGENHPFFGKKLSDDTKQKISLTNKCKFSGENNPMFGKKCSDATKAKNSKYQKAIYLLWNTYKSNNGIKSYSEFRKALKSGDITFEMQSISVFIN